MSPCKEGIMGATKEVGVPEDSDLTAINREPV